MTSKYEHGSVFDVIYLNCKISLETYSKWPLPGVWIVECKQKKSRMKNSKNGEKTVGDSSHVFLHSQGFMLACHYLNARNRLAHKCYVKIA